MRSAALQALTTAIKARHPGVIIGGIGDAAHKLRASDHNEDDTAGSRAAQSDPDSNPEHRAIDVMLGPAFSRADALMLIADLLADPAARDRLRYINFERTQWSRSNNWAPVGNSDDPHDNHIHISGLASKDEDTGAWLTGGDDVTLQEDVTWAGARIEAITHLFDKIRYGPEAGKAVPVVAAVKRLDAAVAELSARPPVHLSDADRVTIGDLAAEAVLAQLLPTLNVDLIAEKVAEKLAARLAQ